MRNVLLAALALVAAPAPPTPKPKATAKHTSPAAAIKTQKQADAPRAAQAPAPARAEFSSVAILYTASARGQVRSCNCTKFRFGGYGRELTLLKSIRSGTQNSILVEGGDAVEWTGFQSELKTEVAAHALKLLGYQAMTPGEDELGRAASRYMGHFDESSVPIVCANYCKDGSEKPTYPACTVAKTDGGARIGLIGLLSPSTARLFEEEDFKAAVKDPLPALKSAMADIRPKSDLVVVLFHGPMEEAEKLTAVKGIDVILCTHRTKRDILFPDQSTNEVACPTEKHGDVVIANAETVTNWSLGRIDLELTRDHKIKSVNHKLIYLDRHYDEAPEMVKVYEDYNEKVKGAVLTASAQFKKDSEAMLTKRVLNLEAMRSRLHKSPFETDGKCKECHKEVYEIWSNSRHAHAMATLEKTHQDFDPECISCHATGTKVRNGFANNKETPELANVQCEECHGPGLAHIAAPKKDYGHVDEQTCRGCHTDERAPDFDYGQAWAKIMH